MKYDKINFSNETKAAEAVWQAIENTILDFDYEKYIDFNNEDIHFVNTLVWRIAKDRLPRLLDELQF